MNVKKPALIRVRRLKTPGWAVNDQQLREIILRLAEARFYLRDHSGTDSERMARIDAAAKATIPHKKEQLEHLLALYSKYVAEGKDQETLTTLQIQTQNLDTELLVLQRGYVKLASAIAYRYYRQGFNSVQIAEEFGVRSPMVRMWLFRMHTAGMRLSGTVPIGRGKNKWTRNKTQGACSQFAGWDDKKIKQFFALRLAGVSWYGCAKELSVQNSNIKRAWSFYFGKLQVAGPTFRVPEWSRELRLKRGPRVNPVWTPDKIARLRKLREQDGKTFREIAEVLGFKRCQDAQGAYARNFGKRATAMS